MRLPEKGITLIEILVTIAIVAIISMVAIPNLRQLNQSQDLENATADLVQNLRKAQTNDTAGAPCLDDISATGWWVEFDAAAGEYKLVASCHDIYNPVIAPSPAPTPYDETRSIIKFPSSIVLTEINDPGCLSKNLKIYFSDNSVSFTCDSEILTSNPVVITLRDTRSVESHQVSIDKGGSIERN